MKFQLPSALAVMLASVVMAAPSTSQEQQRSQEIQQMLAKLKNHGQVQPVQGRLISNTNSPASTIDDGNWGGVSIPGSGITQVEATFTVPNVTLASNDAASGTFYGCAWVGIDGDDSCSKGLWQAGAYWLYSNDKWEYFPFFEWYPGPVMSASLTIAPGDCITVKIVATSTTSGTYYFTNNDSGETATGSLSSQPELCEATAEFIVENNNDSGVEMPDFHTVQFIDASFVAGGATKGVTGGNTYVVDDDNVVYTDCTVSGSNTVTCNWTS